MGGISQMEFWSQLFNSLANKLVLKTNLEYGLIGRYNMKRTAQEASFGGDGQVVAVEEENNSLEGSKITLYLQQQDQYL